MQATYLLPARVYFFICMLTAICSNAQWTMQYNSQSGSGYSKIQMLNSSTGYASDFKYVYKTINGGTNWYKIDSTTLNNGITDIHAASSNDVYVLYTGGNGFASYIKYSNNGGSSWTTSSSFGATSDFYRGIHFTSTTTGYVAGNQGKIYKTVNSGATWALYTVSGSTNFQAIDFPSATTGYAVGDNSAVYKTTNSGTSWNNLNIPTAGIYSSLDFRSVDTGFVAGTSGISRTYNGGTTWTSVYTGGINSVDYGTADTIYAAHQGSFILGSYNKGTSWDTLNAINSASIQEIDFRNGLEGYAATAGTKIYFTFSGAWACPTFYSTANNDTVCAGNNFNVFAESNYFSSISPLTFSVNAPGSISSTVLNGFGGYSTASSSSVAALTFTVILNNTSLGCANDTAAILINAVQNNFVPAYPQQTNIEYVCVGDTLHLGTGAYNYEWKSTTNQLLSTNEYLVITPALQQTQLYCWVTTCAGLQMYYIFTNPDPNCGTTSCTLSVNGGNDIIYCGNCGYQDTLMATPSYTANVIAQWSPTANLSSATSFTTAIMMQCGTNTNYVITVTDTTNGCTATDTVYTLAMQNVNQSSSICGNQNITLTQPAGAPSYTWSGNHLPFTTTTTNTITVNQQDTIYGIAYFNGCALTSLYMIDDTCSALPPCTFTVDAGSSVMYCAGTQANAPQLNPTVTPSSSNYIYQWSPAGGLSDPSIANPVASFVYDQTYTLTVTDTSANCSVTDTVVVTSLPYINDSIYNCNGSPVSIYNPPGAYYYQWMNGFTPPPGTSQNSTIITNPGFYSWAAYYNGCAVTNMITLIDSCSVQIGNVWPGDCNYDLIADYIDFLNIALAYGNTGASRPGASMMWTAQPMTDWGTASYNADDKHSDCDGNGIVDTADINAIIQNYNNIHPYKLAAPQVNSIAPDLYLVANKDTVGLGDTVTFDIMLGKPSMPVDSIYAVAYQIVYEAALTDNVGNVNYINSWFGTPGADEISLEKQLPVNEQIDCGVGGNNKINRSGQGKIGEVNIIVTTDNLSGIAVLNVDLQNAYAVTANGTSVPLNLAGDSVIIDQVLSVSETDYLNAMISMYPNPAKDEVHVNCGKLSCFSVMVFDLMGNQVVCEKQNAGGNSVRISNLAKGVYTVSITTDRGRVNKKLVIQ